MTVPELRRFHEKYHPTGKPRRVKKVPSPSVVTPAKKKPPLRLPEGLPANIVKQIRDIMERSETLKAAKGIDRDTSKTGESVFLVNGRRVRKLGNIELAIVLSLRHLTEALEKDDLFQGISYRQLADFMGWKVEYFQAALGPLRTKGLITNAKGMWVLTDQGKAVPLLYGKER